MWKAERADPAGAAEALKNGFAVAHTLAQEPMVIAVLEFVQPPLTLSICSVVRLSNSGSNFYFLTVPFSGFVMGRGGVKNEIEKM